MKITTGDLKLSRIHGVFRFTPAALRSEQIEALSISPLPGFPEPDVAGQYEDLLGVYFLKLLAGDKCLSRGCADIDNLELFLWHELRHGSSHAGMDVSRAINRFRKAQRLLSRDRKFSVRLLRDIHRQLCPKTRRPGFRNGIVRLGNPANNEFAFYAPRPEKCPALLRNLMGFLNGCEHSVIDKALIFHLQFALIHPFFDGNGRTARLLCIDILREEYGLLYSSLLLVGLKNIYRGEYYLACSQYLKGDALPLREFFLKLTRWAKGAQEFMLRLLSGYRQQVGENNKSGSLVKLVSGQDRPPDEDIWQVHIIKNDAIIYVNHLLRSVLAQFDFYLKSELRRANLEYDALSCKSGPD